MRQKRDTGLIPKESFKKMISQNKVFRARGGIVHEILGILQKNAATVEAIAKMLKARPKTVMNSLNYLRYRYNKKLLRFYNPKDRKYYYYLDE